jgi:hypothetical protein
VQGRARSAPLSKWGSSARPEPGGQRGLPCKLLDPGQTLGTAASGAARQLQLRSRCPPCRSRQSAPFPQRSKAGRDELAVEAVEHDVHTLAVSATRGPCRQSPGCAKLKRWRMPCPRENAHLPGLAVAKTSAPSNCAILHRGLAHPARSGVDQHPFPRLQPGRPPPARTRP